MIWKWIKRIYLKRKAKRIAKYHTDKWAMRLTMDGKHVTEEGYKRMLQIQYEIQLIKMGLV